MWLCDDGHDEVCYESKRCPVCVEMVRTAELAVEVQNLCDVTEKLTEELEEAKNELSRQAT